MTLSFTLFRILAQDLEVLERIIAALGSLTKQRVSVSDLLDYQEEA